MSEQQIRIPNIPLGKMVNEDGTATLDMMTFMQTLVSNLQNYFGNEGIVAPSQDQTNITQIAANTKPNPSGGVPIQTLLPGTILYNSTTNKIVGSVLVGTTATFVDLT
ncbi:MAG: hypothetical protein EPO02_12795 [Nitrospirae bacterium]|nr:MAG: hypothetical protein EPO02_12795 [Nitrospirota bacterium]